MSGTTTTTFGRAKVAGLAVTFSVLVGLGAGQVAAKSIGCAFATECSGSKKADTIVGEGQNNLFGKGGNDKITAVGGASVIGGGAGNDRIVAIDGFNIIRGGKGDDTIEAQNGKPDSIDCGPGKDSVVFDEAGDDVVNCEKQQT